MGRTIVDIDAQMEKRGFLCKCLTSLTFSVARFGNQAASDQGKAGNFTGQGWGLVTLLTLVSWESEAIDASEKGYGWYEPQHPPNCIMDLLYNRNLQFSLTNCFGLIIPVSHSPFIATPKKRDNIHIYIYIYLSLSTPVAVFYRIGCLKAGTEWFFATILCKILTLGWGIL